MKLVPLLLLAAFMTVAHSAEIKLSDGELLTNARIVAITGDQVTIVHSGGSVSVSSERVDLEVLARAHIALAEKTATQKQRAEEVKAKADQWTDEQEQLKKDRVALALAESAARGNTHTDAPQKQPPPPGVTKKNPARSSAPSVDIGQHVLKLKAAFPAKVTGRAQVFIPKSGSKNSRPHIVSSSASSNSKGTTQQRSSTYSRADGRVESIQYDAPSEDMWSWYKSTFQTTTPQALPRTLQLVEERLAQDRNKMEAQAGGGSMSGQAQAQHTLKWFSGTLEPYIKRWRELR